MTPRILHVWEDVRSPKITQIFAYLTGIKINKKDLIDQLCKILVAHRSALSDDSLLSQV